MHVVERFQEQQREKPHDEAQTSKQKKKKSTNLLVQHSTGSGKSLTIAALAYQLARLRLFKVVLILTDRRVLDRQIAHGVRHFLFKNGWHRVHSITSCEDLTRQLAAAGKAEGSTVLISTIQKFRIEEEDEARAVAPAVSTKGLLKGVRVAVLCDEAHRSYGGVATSNLLEMLGGESHMRGSNASFVGFTATPAESTLQLFGERTQGVGCSVFRPFDTYSMRQALADGHIVNVLQRYCTMEARVELCTLGSANGPPCERQASVAKDYHRLLALHDAVREHDKVLHRKADFVLDHFSKEADNAAEAGLTKPKAMIVCRSRAHVVRFARRIQDGATRRGRPWRVFASFSGNLELIGGEGLVSESGMNRGVSLESADIYVVCNKLETGFDEPRLVSMYIDRHLHGAHCVQVLGRLNRICEGKLGTSVVDFVNSAVSIQQSFEQFWEETRCQTGPGHALELGERALDGYLANVLLHMGSLRGLSVAEAVKRVASMGADARSNVDLPTSANLLCPYMVITAL